MVILASVLWARGSWALTAQLENPDEPLIPGAPTVFQVAIQNETVSPVYITGASVHLSDNAVGEVYTSAFQQEGLNRLAAGQRWDGPLVKITPRHRGPLGITGSIVVTGGTSGSSITPLVSVPLRLWVSDTKRDADGGYLRGALALCDRPASGDCCEPNEAECWARAGHCLYVAQGFDQERVCSDGRSDHVYEHVTDLQTTADGAHVAYRGYSQCSTDGTEEHCRRTVVVDHLERPSAYVPGPLSLSADGHHYQYTAYQSCVQRLGQEVCTGRKGEFRDGQKISRSSGS